MAGSGFPRSSRRILIAKYFEPDARLSLYALVGMPVPSDGDIVRDADYRNQEQAQIQGREARFRLSIVAAYIASNEPEFEAAIGSRANAEKWLMPDVVKGQALLGMRPETNQC